MAHKQSNATGYYRPEEPPPLFASVGRAIPPVSVPASAAKPASHFLNMAAEISSSARAASSALKPLPQAADIAAACSGKRRRHILMILSCQGEHTLYELAQKIGCHDHQISGRITDLKRDLCITTCGQRAHPVSHCACDVYAITPAGETELGKAGTR